VAYDPRDPRRAYLMPGPSSSSIVLLTLGVVLMSVAFLIGRLHRRA
jgi:hypothetical protein